MDNINLHSETANSVNISIQTNTENINEANPYRNLMEMISETEPVINTKHLSSNETSHQNIGLSQLGDPCASFPMRSESSNNLRDINRRRGSVTRRTPRQINTVGFEETQHEHAYQFDLTVGIEAFMREERLRRSQRENLRISRFNRNDTNGTVESSSENDEVDENAFSSEEISIGDEEATNDEQGSKDEFEESEQIIESSDEEKENPAQNDNKANLLQRTADEMNTILQQKYSRRLVCTTTSTKLLPENEADNLKKHQFNHLREKELLKKISGPIPFQNTTLATFGIKFEETMSLFEKLSKKKLGDLLPQQEAFLIQIQSAKEEAESILATADANRVSKSQEEAEPETDLEFPYNILLTSNKKSFPITARDISTFLIREDDNDEYSKCDKVENVLIQFAYDCVVKCLDNIKDQGEEAQSMVINFDTYPIKLLNRSDITTANGDTPILRPCLIDGMGVAFAYDAEFSPKWEGTTNMYLESKVLPIYPIFQTVFRLVLMGHKVTIILPKYYELPYFPKQKRLKVDNVFAFDCLVNLKLVQFIEADNIQEFMAKIQEISQKEGSIIFTSTQLSTAHKAKDESIQDPGEFEVMYEINTSNRLIDMQKKERAEKNSSERLMGISFQTITKEIVLFQQYMTHIGIDSTDHEERKHTYHTVPKDVVFFYTDVDGDVRNPEIQLANQLSLYQQSQIILAICDLYELPKFHLRAAQLLLRFARMMGIALEEFDKFIAKHPRFPPPTKTAIEIAMLNLSNLYDKEEDLPSKENQEHI